MTVSTNSDWTCAFWTINWMREISLCPSVMHFQSFEHNFIRNLAVKHCLKEYVLLSSSTLTHQSRSVDHRQVVAVKERWPQGTEEGRIQQTGSDRLLLREHMAQGFILVMQTQECLRSDLWRFWSTSEVRQKKGCLTGPETKARELGTSLHFALEPFTG